MKINEDGSTTYTQDDLKAMDKTQAMNVFMSRVKIKGTAVLRRADGSIKYAASASPGTYGEEVN